MSTTRGEHCARRTFRRTAAKLIFATALLLAAGGAWAQQSDLSVQVSNLSFRPNEVRIVDAVCGDVLFEGRIINQASVLVTPCKNMDG